MITNTTESQPVKATTAEQHQEHGPDCQCMICTVCNWIYDPKIGEPSQDVAAGTVWDDVPEYFLCPDCNLGKDVFIPHSAEEVA